MVTRELSCWRVAGGEGKGMLKVLSLKVRGRRQPLPRIITVQECDLK